MKNVIFTAKKKIAGILAAALLSLSSMPVLTAFAGDASSVDADLSAVTRPIEGLLKSVFNVGIGLVAAIGALYSIFLGVKLSKAEEPQEREKAKQHLKNAIIGFMLIFVLVVALRIGTPIMTEWMDNVS